MVGLEDPPRPEVPAAVQRCQEAGIKVIMGLFGTAPIPGVVWAFMVPFALVMLALEELRKAVVRVRSLEGGRP
ncbi:MAG: hypothetical protein HY701_10950 [Gemmatimonadetes bacterium]|nr:hypothetical protein [Gemmatimonadota bacterium]